MSASLGHVVVGGGTGFIGSHLVRLLKHKGYEYTIISRTPGHKSITWHELENVGLPMEATAVVNLAGQNVLDFSQRWNEDFKQTVWNSRIKTTNSLTQAIMKTENNIKSFISMSGIGIYKPDNGVEYIEESDVNDFDFFSKLCIEWEKASKLPSHINCRQINLRCGVVIGYDGGMIKKLYLPFYLGFGGPVAPGNQYLPWIHVLDAARLILYGIEQDIKGIFNCVAPQQITNQCFTDAFATALWRPALIPVSQSVLNVLLNKERANMLTKGPRVVPKRILDHGFKYIYPDIASACKEVVTSPKKLHKNKIS